MALFRASHLIDAPPERVWEALCDWEAARHWMVPPTTVAVVGERREGLGTRLRAVTTFAGIVRLVDTFVVTEWVPLERIRVRHVGWMVRGDGIFELERRAQRTRFIWIEDVPLPLGVLGEVVGLLLRPLIERLMRRSCGNLAGVVPL